LNRMKRLFIHLALTLVITLGIIYSVDNLGLPARVEDDIIPIVVLLFIAHALWLVYQEARYSIIQQEMQRSAGDDEAEKPKHQLEISDDGELVEVFFDDAEPEKVKHGG